MSLSEEGRLATQTASMQVSLTHTGEELTEGRHYWEVEVVNGYPIAGVCRPDADPAVPTPGPNTLLSIAECRARAAVNLGIYTPVIVYAVTHFCDTFL